MLEVIKFNEDEYNYPCLLVLGCFDGLHLGHSELLKKAKLQAKINGLDLGVMMFTNGKEGKEGKQLYTFEERLKFLESFNVKFVLKIDYTDEFKKIKPIEFLNFLEEKLNVKAYMSGKDFRFGEGAKGKVSTLKSFAEDEENGVWFMPIKDFTIDNEKVSTSHIKALLDEGNVKKAGELLGRNYAICGTVIHGADRGAKVVGFPTMNIAYPVNKHEVKEGVYTVKCAIGEHVYYGIANYGGRPTFDEVDNLFEVYLDGFEETYYGEIITVEFLNYIREIQKFDSAESLNAQLSEDILHAREAAEAAAAQAAAAAAAAPAPVAPTPAPAPTPVTQEAPAATQEVVEEKSTEVAEETVEPSEEPKAEETEEKDTESTDEAVSD
ncbi:MAG: riboflavin biosynthesis protein RibF [Clostridia bacterium]|nr:riboflavin biosynthesis protein RibF [Clostridia bacterium]